MIKLTERDLKLAGVKPLKENGEYEYMLLSRLQQDCEYYLNHGGRNEKHLWAGNVKDHIGEMKGLWNALTDKPEWISMEDIEKYEEDMSK